MAKVDRYEISEDWPVKGEAGRSFAEKLKNGFFSTYMAGEVTIDVGYRGAFENAVPILPHAIGVDLDYAGYDGKRLPFADETIDTVYSSHMLEHVTDFRYLRLASGPQTRPCGRPTFRGVDDGGKASQTRAETAGRG